MRSGLEDLAGRTGKIREVRSARLFLGVEMGCPGDTAAQKRALAEAVTNRLRENLEYPC